MRALIIIALVAIVAIGGMMLFSGPEKTELTEIEPMEIKPVPPKVENEVNDRLIGRLISEDADIKAALEGESEQIETADAGSIDNLNGAKSNDEILFDMMSSWFYMGFRNIINDQKEGQFKNTRTQRKSGWLSLGGILEGAEIIHLDPDKAVVQFADATHEFLYVPEFPEKYDPTVPRTPEQIAAAQRRYSQVYMPTFIRQGREYDRLRGQPSFEIPTKKEQAESGLEYLEYARQFAENAAASTAPKEALIDASELTPEQREAHERYTQMFQRDPQDVLQNIETQRQTLEQELGEPAPGSPPEGSPSGSE